MKNKHPILKAAITLLDSAYFGYSPLTHPYMPDERWMLNRAITHLERGNIDYALVVENIDLPDDLSIFRK